MNCDKISMLFMKYMDNTLEESEAEQLNQHIKGCSKCNDEFNAYDQLMTEFLDMTELVQAPEGFEESVMDTIKSLPKSRLATNEKKDNFMYFVWIAISVVLGIGVLLTLYKDSIITYLSANPSLNFILQIFEPISTSVSNIMVSFIYNVGQLLALATTMATEYRYFLLAGCLVFAGIYFFRTRSNASKNTKD